MLSLLSRELALSVGSESLNSQSKLLAGVIKAGMAIYSQNDISTWSFLPQKILVASFLATKSQSYNMIIYAKDGTKLSSRSLVINKNSLTKNTYKHFFLKEEKMCY